MRLRLAAVLVGLVALLTAAPTAIHVLATSEAATALSAEELPYGRSANRQPIPAGIPSASNASSITSCLSRTVKASKPAVTISGEVPAINVARSGDPIWSITYGGSTYRIPGPSTLKLGTGADHPAVIRVPFRADTGHGTFGPQFEVRLWQARLTGTRKLSATRGGLFDYGPNGNSTPFPGTGGGLGDGRSWTGLGSGPQYRKTGAFHEALRFTMNNSQGCWNGRYKAPATKTDRSGSGPISMGQRWQLSMTDAEINRQVSPTGRADHTALLRAILRAGKTYGFIVGDGDGPGFLLEFEDDASAQWGIPQAPAGYGFGMVIRGPSSSGCSGTCGATSGLPFDRLRPLAYSTW
jgi:hypothetical protein